MTPRTLPRMSPSGLKTWMECRLKWYFEKVEKHRSPDTRSTWLGTRIHASVEVYLAEGSWPEIGRTLDLGRRDGTWEVDAEVLGMARPGEAALTALRQDVSGGLPSGIEHVLEVPAGGFLGALRGYMVVDWWDGTPRIIDHKSTKALDAPWHHDEDSLARDVQGLMYGAVLFREERPKTYGFGHFYYQTQKAPGFRSLMTTIDWSRTEDFVGFVGEQSEEMKNVALDVAGPDEVPYSRKACGMYGGCPHIHRCPVHTRDPFAILGGSTMGMMDFLTDDDAPEAVAAETDAPSVVPPDTSGTKTPTAAQLTEAADAALMALGVDATADEITAWFDGAEGKAALAAAGLSTGPGIVALVLGAVDPQTPSDEAQTTQFSAEDEAAARDDETFAPFANVRALLARAGGSVPKDSDALKAAVKDDLDLKALRKARLEQYLRDADDAGAFTFTASEVRLLTAQDEAPEAPAPEPTPEAPVDSAPSTHPAPEPPEDRPAAMILLDIAIDTLPDGFDAPIPFDTWAAPAYAKVEADGDEDGVSPHYTAIKYNRGPARVYGLLTHPLADGKSMAESFEGALTMRGNHPMVPYLARLFPGAVVLRGVR